MPANKRKLILNTVSVSVGCGSCRKPKASQIFHPKPKQKPPACQNPTLNQFFYDDAYAYATPLTTNTTTTTPTTTTFSPNDDESSSRPVSGFGGKIGGGETVAVEKDSDDPYLDFRHSMLQMIMENEIYSKDDLKELLNCFLQLNSPYHHGIIVRAFTEIWNGVFSAKSASPKLPFGCRSRDFF